MTPPTGASGSRTPQARQTGSEEADDLSGQVVVIIGGSSGIGLATARRARAAGAAVIITGRDAARLSAAAGELDAHGWTAFDATDPDGLTRFFDSLSHPIDHLMVTGPGPYYASLDDFDFARGERDIVQHLWLPIRIAKRARTAMRPGGTLLLIGGTGARRPAPGLVLMSPMTVAQPALAAVLAVELAPIRVNLIACGFVDTPLSASLLGDQLEDRRKQLRESLPIGRVVGADDVARLAVQLMTNTAVTGATFDIDGGQQLIS
jgi:NAD(P)-dependent dehydrogenase (short-subunit alcohol dehydrogenase family)